MKPACRKRRITLASAMRLLEQQATVPRLRRQRSLPAIQCRSDLRRYSVDRAVEEPARLGGVEFN